MTGGDETMRLLIEIGPDGEFFDDGTIYLPHDFDTEAVEDPVE
jgi:hypothetical protein